MPDNSAKIRFSVATDVGGIGVMHAAFQRRGVPPHFHDEYSLSVPLEGGLAFDYRGSKHCAASGVISCIPPGEVHNAYPAHGNRWVFVSLLVPAALVTEILGNSVSTVQLPGLPQRVISDPHMARCLISLHGQLEIAGDLLERQSACTLVIADFFQTYSTLRGRASSEVRIESRPVQRARELLHECYGSPVPLAGLASQVGLSPYHFLRSFRSAVGLTPHMYLNQVRVLQARRRLAQGMPAAEVALACGFCDQSHMARQFKRASLVTPGQYQRAFNSNIRLKSVMPGANSYTPDEAGQST